MSSDSMILVSPKYFSGIGSVPAERTVESLTIPRPGVLKEGSLQRQHTDHSVIIGLYITIVVYTITNFENSF